jgi:hypothetical protein
MCSLFFCAVLKADDVKLLGLKRSGRCKSSDVVLVAEDVNLPVRSLYV